MFQYITTYLKLRKTRLYSQGKVVRLSIVHFLTHHYIPIWTTCTGPLVKVCCVMECKTIHLGFVQIRRIGRRPIDDCLRYFHWVIWFTTNSRNLYCKESTGVVEPIA